MLQKHWRLKNILLLGVALIYGVAIYGRRKNCDKKKVLFLKNFYESPREKFSKRRTYSLDPFLPTLHNGKSIFDFFSTEQNAKQKIRIEVWTFSFQICFWNQFLTLQSGQTENTQNAYLRIFSLITSKNQKLILKADLK